MLSLSHDLHGLWSQAGFTLRPVAPPRDDKELDVQLFWQTYFPADTWYEPTDLLQKPLTAARYFCQRADAPSAIQYRLRYTNKRNNGGLPKGERIISGQMFTLTTSDPKEMPLPSFELLEMQWYLQRVAAMNGVADFPDDLDLDHSSDMDAITAR
jgi:hypothetical protein